LKSQFDYEGEQSEILKGLRKGYIQIHGDKLMKVNLKDITERHVHRVYESVIDEMVTKWKGGKTMAVFVSSGGGEYIIDYVKKYFPHATLMRRPNRSNTSTDPIYDVVKGYAIFGNVKFQPNVSKIDEKRSGTN